MFQDRIVLLSTTFSLIFLQIMLWLLFFNRATLPPQVPFNYLAPWGEARLAPPSYLWYLPTLGGVFLTANLFLSRYFFRREKVVAKLVSLVAAILNLILALSLVRTLNLLNLLTIVI